MKTFQELKSFEDACEVENLDATKVIPDFSCYPEEDRASMIAEAKLIIVIRAANRLANGGKKWIPDWNNSREYKWYPWFYMGGSSGFRFSGYAAWLSASYVGSRLCFISQEVGDHVIGQFFDLYKESFTL